MLLMNGRDEVGAVVHREYRLLCYKRFDVFEECIRTFSLYGKCRDFVDSCECCGDIVLRRKRVRGRKKYIRASRLQCPHEIGGLGRHMQYRRNGLTLERLLFFKSRTDCRNTGISRSAHSMRRIPAVARPLSLISDSIWTTIHDCSRTT